MHTVIITAEHRSTCGRQGATIGCTLLTVEGLPGQDGPHTIEVDDDALAHRQYAYRLDTREALAAIVKEHAQRLGDLPEHPSHRWGGLRDDVTVTGL